MKKLIKCFLVVTMLMALATLYCVTAVAEGSYSGEWGPLTWTLDAAGTLVISGNGEMNDLSYYTNDAWRIHSDTIKNVVIESGITNISPFAFYNCSNLADITIPESVTIIGVQALGGCSSLTSITIPASVTSIGNYVFSNCSNLENIYVNSENPIYCDIDGVLFSKNGTSIRRLYNA